MTAVMETVGYTQCEEGEAKTESIGRIDSQYSF